VDPAQRPLLVYDGECSFCRRALVLWRRAARGRVDDAPFQLVAERFPGVPVDRFRAALHLRDDDGRWWSGAAAAFRGLGFVPGHGLWLRLYLRVPVFAAASEVAYRFVARHRRGLDRVLGWFVPDPGPPHGMTTTREKAEPSSAVRRAK
jgi:predicted DCC family thiol-disulfide oxidoreductase YuxK